MASKSSKNRKSLSLTTQRRVKTRLEKAQRQGRSENHIKDLEKRLEVVSSRK